MFLIAFAIVAVGQLRNMRNARRSRRAATS
jgi:hypothetical protein